METCAAEARGEFREEIFAGEMGVNRPSEVEGAEEQQKAFTPSSELGSELSGIYWYSSSSQQFR